MIELLKLCGFETHEAESELTRVKEVFNKLGITDEDIEQAKQRLTKYYDMELQGVRKMLGLYLRELVNLVLAREEGKTKVIYGIMATFEVIGSALASKSKEVYVAYPGELFQLVLGCMFGKLVPILEAAEREWLKAGVVAHCANPKTLLGLFALDLIPKPDLLVTSDFLCDTAPKTVDLLSELYDIPTYFHNACQDREIKEYPDAKRITDFSAKNMRRLAERMQAVVGFEITDDMLLEELDARKNLGDNISKLLELVECSDPLAISATHEILLSCLDRLPSGVATLPDLVDATNTLYEELQERVSKGLGVLERGAPRIIALNPPHFADPRLEYLIGEVGISLVASEASFFPPDGRRTPDVEKPKDPYEAISLFLLNTLSQSLQVRTRTIVGACKKLKVDGVLCRYHIGCRSVTGDIPLIKDAITKELGLPTLLLEWEGFDPRAYDHENYRRRLEVFKTMMSIR